MTTRFLLSTTLISLLSFVSNSLSAQEIFFVKQGASGDGSSWASPFGDLQKALHRAKYGDEIRVAQGTYIPSQERNRIATFIIPKGVSVLGGYTGTEQETNKRDWENNPTILSGNIGSNDPSDNCYNVVTMKGADQKTNLDGFIISDGYADGDRVGGDVHNIGGGLINEGWKGKSSNPVIKNCIFKNNFAKDGGAVYNNGRAGDASPSFVNCRFEYNETHLDGGAVFNDGRTGGKSNPIFDGCVFIGNKGNYGGAVCNYGVDGESEPEFRACVFAENLAYVKGGAVFNASSNPISVTDYKTVQFSNNSALDHDSDNVHHFLLAKKPGM